MAISIKSGGLCCGCGGTTPGCGLSCVPSTHNHIVTILGTHFGSDTLPFTTGWVDVSSIVDPAGRFKTVAGWGPQLVEARITTGSSMTASGTLELRCNYYTILDFDTTVAGTTFSEGISTSGSFKSEYLNLHTTSEGLLRRRYCGFQRVTKGSFPQAYKATRSGYDPQVWNAASSDSELNLNKFVTFSGTKDCTLTFAYPGGEHLLTSSLGSRIVTLASADVPGLEGSVNVEVPLTIAAGWTGDALEQDWDAETFYVHTNPTDGTIFEFSLYDLSFSYAIGEDQDVPGTLYIYWYSYGGGGGEIEKTFTLTSTLRAYESIPITMSRLSSPYRYEPQWTPGEITYSSTFAGSVQTLTLQARRTFGGEVIGTSVVATSFFQSPADSSICLRRSAGYNFLPNGNFCGRLVSRAEFELYGVGKTGILKDRKFNGVPLATHQNFGVTCSYSGLVVNPDGSWSVTVSYSPDAPQVVVSGGSIAVSGSTVDEVVTASTPYVYVDNAGGQYTGTFAVTVWLDGVVQGDSIEASTHNADPPGVDSMAPFEIARNRARLHESTLSSGVTDPVIQYYERCLNDEAGTLVMTPLYSFVYTVTNFLHLGMCDGAADPATTLLTSGTGFYAAGTNFNFCSTYHSTDPHLSFLGRPFKAYRSPDEITVTIEAL